MRRLVVFLLAFACSLSAKTFTLAQVLSAPFPSELVAAPDGKAVAWVLNERGARNVWYAAAPDFKGVRLTSWTADDGQDVGQLCFTGDGKSVVFVRGGDLEDFNSSNPNPSSDPSGASQDIWMVTPGTAARKISSGHSPDVSKSGRVAFLRGGQVWVDGAPLIQNRGGVSIDDLHWSPDGTKLGFVSDRGNHSYIEVYDFATKAVTYMDPSVDHDSSPVWSGDGKQIAFIRVMQGTVTPTGAARNSTEPWSIRVANVSDGTGKQIWRADAGPGSVFRSVASDAQLLWGAGERIVFPWEKDGWLHLYSVAASGGSATALTPGDFEVEHAGLSGDGKEVVFSSNQGDIDRRHVWSVGVSGGSSRAITKGEGLEMKPVAIANGVAYLHSDATRPLRAAVQLGGKESDLAPDTIPADFPTESLVVPQAVTYAASDGLTIHGQLFLPPDMKAGEKHPAIVFVHGGSRRQMLLGWHSMGYYNNSYAMNQFLANQGYIVLSVNYRSGVGYGLNFREAEGYGPAGGKEFLDVRSGGLYLRSRPDVDGQRIGIWGGSWGGYLVAMGLARASDLFEAGVDFHGVHDWNIDRPVNGPVPGRTEDEAARETKAHLAYASSPIADVKTWKSPVLLIHGDDDRNVPFANTVSLVSALRAQKVDFEQMILPDEIHGFLRHASWLRTYTAAADFFKRKLQN